MTKEMVISCSPHETKVALVEEGRVVEICVEREKEYGLVGSIYKGRVTRVLPGMQSAFVDIGLDRDGFLYVSDFIEDLEDFERVTVAEVEEPETEPRVGEVPSPQPMAPGTEAGPAPAGQPGAEAPAPAPPAVEAQPELEQRQPTFERAEPPLTLPETRPRGRSGRHQHRRHRGGRGPRRPEREPRPEAQREAAPETSEPIILPGESLAKYRHRVPPPPPKPEQTQPEKSARPPAPEPPSEPGNPDTSNGPIKSGDEHLPEEPRQESGESNSPPLGSGEPGKPGQAPQRAQPGGSEPEAEPAPLKEPAGETPPGEVKAASPAAQESDPEVSTLAEIERGHRSENRVGLPPSVQERVAGGVEWERSRGRGSGPGPRGRQRHRHRGGRRRREEPRRPGPRRAHARPSRGQPAIAQLLKSGQEIIIQIAKEQMGKKGARITSHVSLPGRFLVYMPTIDHVGVSRKIGTAEERARLRRLLHELKGNITGGFVVRTAATGCSEDDLREDIDYLVKLWHDIRVQAEERPAPALLHRDLDLVERMLRDHLTQDYEGVWIDSEEEYAKVVEFVGRFQSGLAGRLKLYTKEAPIFEEMGVQQEIDRALQAKVWLKSGGYIVINHTEALVAIDVNTGKFVGKGSTRLEDTIVKTNLEAVQEIVRQIRLRDLGGIIVIDFIDMEDRRNRQRVMRALEDALRVDRSPSKVLPFNEFGLVAITRKRSRQPLERLLCQPCIYCNGTGMVKSLPTLCYEIQNEARKMATTMDAPELTIRANPEIVKALKGREAGLVRELEEQTGKNIILQPDTALHFEQYTIY